MRLPGVPRGPSGHWDCVECGIPRGYLPVLFSSIHPSQTSTRRLSQRLRRDPLRISESLLRCSGRPGVSCSADTVDGSGLPYREAMVTAERVAYVAIWRVCGESCGWCDGAFFTCGERSDAPRWCTRCGWRLLFLLVCECLFFCWNTTEGGVCGQQSIARRGIARFLAR
ncbi:hypothetical protein TcCL_ESM07769 [Trypanosoma cruzi]|nr:hypothetical protein TcCL_ESM07769 [Trypanosoma cruzi]